MIASHATWLAFWCMIYMIWLLLSFYVMTYCSEYTWLFGLLGSYAVRSPFTTRLPTIQTPIAQRTDGDVCASPRIVTRYPQTCRLRCTRAQCICWLIVKVILRNARCNNEDICHLLLLFYFLETQHVSGINMPIFRSMRLYCWTTTLAVSFLVCCVLEFGCGSVGVVSGLSL